MAESIIKGANKRTVTASSIITFESGFSATGGNIYVCEEGNFLQLRFILKCDNAWNAGAQKLIGTIKSGWRPRVIAFIGTSVFTGLVGEDGSVYLRAVVSRSAGSEDNVCTIYLR